MATVRDIVRASFRHIDGVGAGEALPDDYAEDGLLNLIRLLNGWNLKLGTSDDAAALTLNSSFPLDDQFEDAVTLLLAKRLASQYGGFDRLDPVELSDCERLIQAAALTITEMTIDKGLQKLPSQYWGEGTQVRW